MTVRRLVFVDTSAFYAAADPTDQWRAPALQTFRQLSQGQTSLITSNLIVSEAYRLLHHRLGRTAAVGWIASLDSLSMNVFFQTSEEHAETIALLQQSMLPLTYADAASLVTMKRHGIRAVFTFDRHFDHAGVVRLPPPSP